VAVAVVAPVAVAALVSGNDAVAVINARKRGRNPAAVVTDIAGMLHFQKLDLCQRAIEFLTVVNRIRGRLPKGNADLADQLRRASQSIPQDIAEGCGRTARAHKAKHYTIARGSAMECAAHLDVMKLDELVESELYESGVDLLERIVAMLTKLIDP
jgi:four helix bundle protein